MSILSRASRNFLFQHPWQLALALLGITMGVAVVIAIDLALESSMQAFEQAGKTVSGKASHRIMVSDGGLDDQLYTLLRVELGIQSLSPVIQGHVRSSQDPEESFKLFGIDPFIERSFQSGWQNQSDNDNPTNRLTRLLTEPNTILISRLTAQRLQLKIDDVYIITTANGDHQLIIAGFLEGNAATEKLLDNLIFTDISTAQELLDMDGKLSYIEVLMETDPDQSSTLKKIRNVLPANALLITSETRQRSMRQMTRAFSINLTALGLLSLLVGMFLIYNTMTFLVIQRRSLIGSLRSIGVTRQQIFTLILTEALLLAAIGTILGIITGIIIGQQLLHLVSSTINTIYFSLDVTNLHVTPVQLFKGILLGFGATILAVLPPAFEAAHLNPGSAMIRSTLESRSRRLIQMTGIFGICCITGGILLALFSGKNINLGLGSIFLLLFGFALLTPNFTLLLMKPVEIIAGRLFGISGKLPPRMVAAEISRTGIAIAALMIAVSATIGMDLMIDSFRQTVSQWIKTSLRADLYVSLSGNSESGQKALQDHTVKRSIAMIPAVNKLSSVLHTKVVSKSGLTPVSVFELNDKSKPGFIFKQVLDKNVWKSFEHDNTIFITEPYAYHRNIEVGQNLYLQNSSGQQAFKVVAIYADYSGDRGHLAMHRNLYQRYWPDLGYTGIGIYARPGANLIQLENEVQQLLAPHQTVKSDHSIYQASMDVFEQTFTITDALRWLAAGIAFVGVFSALMALQFERTRQLGILRAIGITPQRLTALIVTETGLMGLVAGLIAIPVGYIVAYVLIFIIYQRSFGWTLAFHFNSAVLYQGLFLALAAALLAGMIPALKMARIRPAEALRTE